MSACVRRSGLLVAAVSLLAIGSALAAAPSALAASDYAWTGAGSSPDWSLGANWSGGQGLQANQTYPPLFFEDLPSCDGSTSTAPCYSSTDDVPVTLDKISLDDDLPYAISASNGVKVTLLGSSPGGGAAASTGIDATPRSSGPSGTTPEISAPIVIPAGSDQTWDIAGDSSGHQQSLAVDSLDTASALDLDLTEGASLISKSITGGQAIAVSGGAAENTDNLDGTLRFDGAAGSDLDPGGSIALSDGANLDVTTSGTVDAGGIDFVDGSGGELSVGTGQAPDTVLSSDGDVTFYGGIDFLALALDSACASSGCAAGTDNSELTSSAAVDLAGTALTLSQGTDAKGFCDDLVIGQTYTLVSAQSITGTFAGVPDGTSYPLGEECGLGPQATSTYVTIHYTSTAITATVTAVGNAGDVPQNTGAAPVITNKSRKVPSIFAGDTLSVSRGTWNVSGSTNPQTALSYGYAWMRCTASGACSQIGGQSTSTYTTSASDVGDMIYAEVTATNRLGSKQVSSAKVGPVLAVVAPSNTSAPTIGGTATPGSTLTVTSRGSWSGSPAPTYKYQWLLCSQASASSCTATGKLGGTRSLKLTTADLGLYVAVEVSAGNRGGTTLATSNLIGRVVPTSGTVLEALVPLRHPSGRKAVQRLIRRRRYSTRFTAPSGGTLRIVWRTRITVGRRGHRRHRSVTVGTYRGNYVHLGVKRVTVHLTPTGRRLLRRRPYSLRIVATESFAPIGGRRTTYRKHFRL